MIGRAMTALVRGALRLSMRGLPRGAHVTRYAMYAALDGILARLADPVPGQKTLSVSGSAELCRRLGLGDTTIVEGDYPEVDLLALPWEDGSFDFVVSDQVLEHVEGSPLRAVEESFRVLRPGGWVVHTTCFINPVHPHPKDFWRFTPDALALLCRGSGTVELRGGWGNPWVWPVAWLGLRFDGIPHARWHPLHQVAVRDDPEWPVVTWVVARKDGP